MITRKIIVASLVLSSILSGCGGGGGSDDSSGGSETGNDRAACNLIGLQPKVINGTTCTDTIRSSVVRLANVDSRGVPTSIFCTGTVIAPRTVLTAEHCAPAISSNTAIIAGDPGAIEAALVAAVSVAPGFRSEGSRLFNDAAIVYLDRDISSPSMPVLLSRSAEVGEPGYVYGYGRTIVGDGANPEQGIQLQGGTMKVREVTENHLFVLFDGNVNVCNGDSGGPLVVAVNGQPAVAGVVSTGSTDACSEGDVTTFTNLQSPSVLGWLANAAPNAFIR